MNIIDFLMPLLVILCIFAFFKLLMPRLIYSGKLTEISIISEKIRESGKRLYSLSCGGIISGFSIGKRFLNIEVYPGGIWIKPVFVSPFAIERGKIIHASIVKKKYNNILKVEHSSKTVQSPIEINLGEGDYSEIIKYMLNQGD